jgi:poly(ADP-ribose) glycohydrolase ARH3
MIKVPGGGANGPPGARVCSGAFTEDAMLSSVSIDRFVGCLLGQAVGDGLGAPYEGVPADHIFWCCGSSADIVGNPTGDTLLYTDDTQMMIGVAEVLAEHGTIVEEDLCRAFATNYDPVRGYGQGARRILEAIVEGDDWRELARTIFPGGSLGNGAAMRVAPVGLLFCDDLDRVMEEARRSAEPTHLHPLGIEGAQLLALAVALAVRGQPLDRPSFYAELLGRCRSEEFAWQLRAAARMKARSFVGVLGNSLEAHRSVVTAIACFTTSPKSYTGAVGKAISLGDDTDTLAAMTGALCGAHLGVEGIPAGLAAQLEDRHKGRSYIRTLAERLAERYRSDCGK